MGQRQGERRRAGMAPLEFALVFPLLLALVAGMILVARADLAKTLTATRARKAAWDERPQASPGGVLRAYNDPDLSFVGASRELAVTSGPLFGGTPFRAASFAGVIAGTWDARDLPFEPGRPTFDPHRDELRKVLDNLPMAGAIAEVGLGAFALALNADGPLYRVADWVGRAANFVVRAAGTVLKISGTPPVLAAKITVDVTRALLAWTSLIPEASGLREYLDSLSRVFGVALDAFNNLYEASRGYLGSDEASDVRWLRSFRP